MAITAKRHSKTHKLLTKDDITQSVLPRHVLICPIVNCSNKPPSSNMPVILIMWAEKWSKNYAITDITNKTQSRIWNLFAHGATSRHAQTVAIFNNKLWKPRVRVGVGGNASRSLVIHPMGGRTPTIFWGWGWRSGVFALVLRCSHVFLPDLRQKNGKCFNEYVQNHTGWARIETISQFPNLNTESDSCTRSSSAFFVSHAIRKPPRYGSSELIE